MSEKRKCVVLGRSQILEIIKRLRKGESVMSIAPLYGIGRTTVNDIKKDADKIESRVSKMQTTDGDVKLRKTKKPAKLDQLDTVMYQWFIQARSQETPVSGSIIMAKAIEMNKKLDGDPSFKIGFFYTVTSICCSNMGNKTSKKTGASMAADKYKRPLSTSCRGSTQLVARHQDDRSEWVMVLNATAYIRSGTLGNAGVTPRGAKQTESQHPVRTVQRNEGKSHHPISNIKEKNTVVSHTQHNFCVNKQMGIVATPQNYNTNKIPAVTGNTITVCNSAVRKDIFEARLTANKGNDWSKTMTLKANEAKQQTTGCTGREQLHLQIEDKPQHNQIAQLGIDRDARAVEGFMWQQVNRAERGRWNHFRRVGGGKYKCTMCNVSLSSQQSVIEHVWGKFHQANLDKKCVNETEEDLMWRQVPNPEKFHRNYINEIDADNKPLFYCSICKVELPFTYQNLLTHIRGRNHREEVKFQ